MGNRDTTIDAIETWYLSVPLETPIVLGSLVITTRDFVIVRVRTRGGLEGVAYSLTRGAPLDLVINDVLAPEPAGQGRAGNRAASRRADALDSVARRGGPRAAGHLARGHLPLGHQGVVPQACRYGSCWADRDQARPSSWLRRTPARTNRTPRTQSASVPGWLGDTT